MMRTLAFIFVLLPSVLAGAPPPPEKRNVAPNGTFERDLERSGGWLPVGVVPPGDKHGIVITESTARGGKRSLAIKPGPPGVIAGTTFFADYNGGEGKRLTTAPGGVRGCRTVALRLDHDTVSLEAQLWVKKPPGAAVTVSAVWTTRRRRRPVVEIGRESTDEPAGTEAAWIRYELRAHRPHDALQVQLWIETDAKETLYLDDVQLTFQRAPRTTVLVNQLGYETASRAKGVVLQSSVPISDPPPARVIELDSFIEVYQAAWSPKGYLPSWDLYHWTADFSALTRPGRYVVAFGRRRPVYSPPFQIADDLIVAQTAQLSHRFYYYQRCGMAVPGFHAACHLDDARLPDGTQKDLTGGWHDAGDYNKYNGLTPEAVYALVLAYHRKPQRYDRFDRDANGVADILDEALWGARFLRKMLDAEKLVLLNAISSGYRYWGPPEKETDNRPGTGDERPVKPGNGDPSFCVAGFALLGKALVRVKDPALAKEGGEFIALAERLYAKIGGGVDRLLPLHAATGSDHYRKAAEGRVRGLLGQQGDGAVAGFRELALYAHAFPDDPLSARIRPLAKKRVAELESLCDDRFGVALVKGEGGALAYCRRYADVNDWYVGETSSRLDAAIDGLLAAALNQPGGRVIAENQTHWILGRNPLGVSMMEGVGSRFVPQYHHRYNAIPGNPRGAVPGGLINGFIRAWPAVDRPWLDMLGEPNADYHSNEQWLLHNNRWLFLLAFW